MTVFLVIGALLITGAVLFIVPPLLSRRARAGATRDAVNVAVYRDQLRELEADLRAGTLAADQHEKARHEIEARLLADVGGGEAPAQAPRRARAAALTLGLALPICALADYADALAMAQGRTLQGEPEKIILHALAIDPDNVKALLLAGTAAFNRSDPRAAIRHWERVLRLLPKESDMIQRVQASIAQARSLAGSPGGKAQVAKRSE